MTTLRLEFLARDCSPHSFWSRPLRWPRAL